MSGLTTDQEIALWGVIVATISILVAVCVPEVRRFLRLEKSKPVLPSGSTSLSLHGPLSVAPIIPPKVQAVTANRRSAAEDFRAQHQVMPLRPSENEISLDEMPNNSYAFVYAHRLVAITPRSITVYRDCEIHKVEIHKLADGSMTRIVYCGDETLTRIRGKMTKGEKLTLFSAPWSEAKNPTCMSVKIIKILRTRNIQSSLAIDCETM
jgi:hypothetical protein